MSKWYPNDQFDDDEWERLEGALAILGEVTLYGGGYEEGVILDFHDEEFPPVLITPYLEDLEGE